MWRGGKGTEEREGRREERGGEGRRKVREGRIGRKGKEWCDSLLYQRCDSELIR